MPYPDRATILDFILSEFPKSVSADDVYRNFEDSLKLTPRPKFDEEIEELLSDLAIQGKLQKKNGGYLAIVRD